jgi:hypothetical protein
MANWDDLLSACAPPRASAGRWATIGSWPGSSAPTKRRLKPRKRGPKPRTEADEAGEQLNALSP